MASSPWSDDTICERAKELWKDGESMSQIAASLNQEFKISVSRNAVIGKLHRMGCGETRPSQVKREPKPAAPKRQYIRRQKWMPAADDVDPAPHLCVDDAMADQDIPLAQRKSLMELNSETCRWPVGDPSSPDFFFCGAMSAPGQSYCRSHCVRAYAGASTLRPFFAYSRRRAA